MIKRVFKEPTVKYNFETLASEFKEFKESFVYPFAGKYIYRLPILASSYEYFYAPIQALDMYFTLREGSPIPVVFNSFIPTNLIKELVIVRPEEWTSGYVFFQYFLSNSDSKDFQISDLYESVDFIISSGGDKTVRLPFPTLNLKLLFSVQSASPDYNLQILQYFYNKIKSYQTEDMDNITEKIVNTYYLMSGMCGGCGAETNPMNPFPSWHTYINIHNNAGADMTGCFMKVVSWG